MFRFGLHTGQRVQSCQMGVVAEGRLTPDTPMFHYPMLSRTQPGAICPTCKQPLPNDAVAQAQDDLRQKLREVTSRGQGLRSQLNDLTALEKQAWETFEQFHKEDVEKNGLLPARLQGQREKMEQDLRDYEKELVDLNSQIQDRTASLTYGNLDADEMQRLSELHARKQETEEELAALEKVSARPAPDLDTRAKEVDELIRQKKLLMNAAINYLAVRNEFSFASLSMPQVKISLYDLVKTTGELKSAFRFQFNGRDYRRLSHISIPRRTSATATAAGRAETASRCTPGSPAWTTKQPTGSWWTRWRGSLKRLHLQNHPQSWLLCPCATMFTTICWIC